MDPVRVALRAFLADPAAFAAVPPDWQREAWLDGLRFAEQQLTTRPLRPTQRDAWEKSAATRAALVLGPPGTGKTYLLAWMVAGFVRSLRERGCPCRVLFTGFTRESIGNLFDDFVPLASAHLPGTATVFFGNLPEQPLPEGVRPAPLTDADELVEARRLLELPALVAAATGWSLYKLFAGGAVSGGAGPTAPVFDLVVVDEASQLTLAQGLLGLSGLAPGGRVVVAGDDRQLPPVRESTGATAADGRNLGGSLYAFLKSGRAPEYRLSETFRLNAPLAGPPARLFYEGEYSSAVPHRRLELRPDWAAGLSDWQLAALDPEHPLCVLIHDGPPCGTDNPFERRVLRELVAAFATRILPEPGRAVLTPEYLWAERLAVVTPHRAQNAALREEFAGLPVRAGATVETVDRIQGRERDVILAGYTVSDPEFAAAEAEFLFSQERLNVTVTRPRSKLILLVSRRLLEVVPADERTFDATFALREYAFDTEAVARVELPDPGGPVSVELRVRRFTGPTPEQVATPAPAQPTVPEAPPMPTPALAPVLEQLLDAIRQIASGSEWSTAAPWEVNQRLNRQVKHNEYRALVEAGKLSAIGQVSKNTQKPFLVWRPRETDLTPLQCTAAVVRANIDAVLDIVRPADGPAWYDHKRNDHLRDRFLWFDWQGNDLLEPILRALATPGAPYRFSEDGRKFDRVEWFTPPALPVLSEPPGNELSDDDFRVLNALETEEARRINFGAFETVLTPAWLANALGRPVGDVRAALARLAAHHYLMWVEESAVRSRMAELAREVRYVRQRFGPDDADRRPYMIRAVQVRTVPRTKPVRNQKLAPAIDRLKGALKSVAHATQVLDALHTMLKKEWREPVTVAGFQLRSLERLLPAYFGTTKEDVFVITADTGSGKTEAALLPLIAGAAIDRLAGRRGTKAVLVYPRVRLAYNQAQRLVKYLALLAVQPGGAKLTVGLQSKDVPLFSNRPATFQPNGDLENWPGDANTGFEFPLFGCPACGKQLRMRPAGGSDGHDQLACGACAWTFDGWAGSKSRVQQQPPDFFLPVAESLNQWQHDPYSGGLFGDKPDFAPPRALLADEIHLYSHIQGAQIGYTLRRLLARCELNARARAGPPAGRGNERDTRRTVGGVGPTHRPEQRFRDRAQSRRGVERRTRGATGEPPRPRTLLLRSAGGRVARARGGGCGRYDPVSHVPRARDAAPAGRQRRLPRPRLLRLDRQSEATPPRLHECGTTEPPRGAAHLSLSH